MCSRHIASMRAAGPTMFNRSCQSGQMRGRSKMCGKTVQVISCTLWLLLLALRTPLYAQDTSTMRPIDDYLMDEAYEIALAESAGPAGVAAVATILVLRRDGHEPVREGTNGFVCLVERGWTNYIVNASKPSPSFWSPEFIVPVCYNDEAVETVFQSYLLKTEMALAGKTRSEIKHVVDARLADGTLRPPIGPALAYMLSDGQRLGPAGQFVPHVMIYIPYTEPQSLGSDPSGQHQLWVRGAGGPWANILVPMPTFRKAPSEPARRESR